MSAICRHCERTIEVEDGRWIDPAAPIDGDDAMWRESCDASEAFTAEHEPTMPDAVRACHCLVCQSITPARGAYVLAHMMTVESSKLYAALHYRAELDAR